MICTYGTPAQDNRRLAAQAAGCPSTIDRLLARPRLRDCGLADAGAASAWLGVDARPAGRGDGGVRVHAGTGAGLVGGCPFGVSRAGPLSAGTARCCCGEHRLPACSDEARATPTARAWAWAAASARCYGRGCRDAVGGAAPGQAGPPTGAAAASPVRASRPGGGGRLGHVPPCTRQARPDARTGAPDVQQAPPPVRGHGRGAGAPGADPDAARTGQADSTDDRRVAAPRSGGRIDRLPPHPDNDRPTPSRGGRGSKQTARAHGDVRRVRRRGHRLLRQPTPRPELERTGGGRVRILAARTDGQLSR